MAPATPVGGDATTAGVRSLEDHRRWPDSDKVYTRKPRLKPKSPAAADVVVIPSDPPPADDVASAPPVEASGLSHNKEEEEEEEEEEESRIIKIDLRSMSKSEKLDLRKKLTFELEEVRAVYTKLESEYGGGGGEEQAQSQHSASEPKPSLSDHRQLSANCNGDGVIEGFSYEKPKPKPIHRHLTVSVAPEFNYSYGMIEGFEKEKRTPKANSLYHSSDFILIGKDKFPPPESKVKSHGKHARAFRSCTNLLEKLMKHKFSWVFNKPVDVEGLRLFDYYTIIKYPMDLGTVKSRLNKNWYKTPGEFAEDVRLTFRNAMAYNPRGQDVHFMAQQLLQIFEERWPRIKAEFAYFPYSPMTPIAKKAPSFDGRVLERSNSTVLHRASRPQVLKQPKPKAKDLYKRDMTMDEKWKLRQQLENLPPEKFNGLVQVIRKRNPTLCQGDEIELDIDSLDTETLWDLDRFWTNYKKSLSKHKRRAELAMLRKAEAERQRGQERVMDPGFAGEHKENVTAMEGRYADSSFPVGGENQRENASRSSSSSSSSGSGSSSSDSDSGSSSSSSSSSTNGADAAH